MNEPDRRIAVATPWLQLGLWLSVAGTVGLFSAWWAPLSLGLLVVGMMVLAGVGAKTLMDMMRGQQ